VLTLSLAAFEPLDYGISHENVQAHFFERMAESITEMM
jgi:hypothetical protein